MRSALHAVPQGQKPSRAAVDNMTAGSPERAAAEAGFQVKSDQT